MKFNSIINETFQNISINGVLYSLNTDEKKIYTQAKEAGKLMKNDLSEYDQRIANSLVTRGLLKRRKNPQHEIYFVTKGRRKTAPVQPLDEVAPPDANIEKWIEDNKERFEQEYGKEYKKYLYGKAWNKFNGKKMVKESAKNEELPSDIEYAINPVSKVGDTWINKYNNRLYKVVDIEMHTCLINNEEKPLPIYILKNEENDVSKGEYTGNILMRDFKKFSNDEDEDYWDGEEDQLNEGWHYKIDVDDITYDLPTTDYFQLDFDETDEDEINIEDAVKDEINDRSQGPIYDYSWSVDRKWSDDEDDDEEESDPEDDTNKEDYWDGEEEQLDSELEKKINETLKLAGIQINEEVDAKSEQKAKELSGALFEICSKGSFYDTYRDIVANNDLEQFYGKLKSCCDSWAEEIVYDGNYLLDKPYMDVSYYEWRDLIIDCDSLGEDWSYECQEMADETPSDYWDGEDDEELMETKPARLKHHTLEPDAQFAHISAERNNPLYEPVEGETPKIAKYKRTKKQAQKAENNKKTEQLKQDIKDLGLSFIKTYGSWHENDKTTSEQSFIVPNISKEDAMKLGKKYGQYSIIFKPRGEGKGSMYVTLDNDDYGKEDMQFVFNRDDDLEDVDASVPLTNYSGYSGLKKNGHGYSFKYKEPKSED